jgi:hypothetical protein
MAEQATETVTATTTTTPPPEAPAPEPTSDDADLAKAIAIVKGEAEPDADPDADEVPAGADDDGGERPAEQAAAPAPEPKKDEPRPEDKKTETQLEKSWTKLAEADKRLRLDAQKAKEERAALQKDRDEIAALKRAAEEDPFALVEKKYGKDWFELAAQRTLNGGKPGTAEGAAKAKSEAEIAREEVAKLRAELAQKDQQSEADKYVGTISGALASDKYELLRAYPNALDEARSYAAGYLEQHGELLPAAAVLDSIQEALVEQLRAVSKTSAWQTIFAAATSDDERTAPKQQKNSQQPSAGKTLTNKLAARTPSSDDDDSDLDEDERIAKAARLVKFGPA